MDVLLTESAQGLGAPAAAELRALGHRVFQCHPVDGRGDFGCLAAMDGGRCPLDTGGVDVVLDVRGSEPQFTTREYAVVCARRAATPLVVAGEKLPASAGTPCSWAMWCAPGQAVAVTERLGSAGVDVVKAITASVRLVLYRTAYDSRAIVTARDEDGDIEVTVTTDRPVLEAVDAVREAVAAEVAALLPGARVAGVSFVSPGD